MAAISQPGPVAICQYVEELTVLSHAFLREIVIVPGEPGSFSDESSKAVHLPL